MNGMLTEYDALSSILATVRPLDTEELPLFEAGGRIIAETVTAQISLPRFDNSTMDGAPLTPLLEPGCAWLENNRPGRISV